MKESACGALVYLSTKKGIAELGKQLRGLRKEAGLTQTDLAKKCGLRQGNISRIECGKEQHLGLITLVRFVNGCGSLLFITMKDCECQEKPYCALRIPPTT